MLARSRRSSDDTTRRNCIWRAALVWLMHRAGILVIIAASHNICDCLGVFLLGAGHNDLLRHGSAEVALEFLGRLFGE